MVVVVVVVDVRPTTSHLRCSVAEFDPKEMKFAPQTYTSRSVVVELIQIDHRYIQFPATKLHHADCMAVFSLFVLTVTVTMSCHVWATFVQASKPCLSVKLWDDLSRPVQAQFSRFLSHSIRRRNISRGVSPTETTKVFLWQTRTFSKTELRNEKILSPQSFRIQTGTVGNTHPVVPSFASLDTMSNDERRTTASIA